MKSRAGVLCRAGVVAAWCSAVLLFAGSANAGPPFRTDDPEPVELGHYEFYTFSTGTHVSGHTSGFLPAFEFNYGLIPDGQFHIVAPVAFDSPAGESTKFGPGDVELGFKYRFVHED
jgi:subtilisin family serine protease